MKNYKGIIAGIILCGVLVFCGLFYLASAINNKVFTSSFPSAISVDTGYNQLEARDYMDQGFAAAYVGIYDYDVFSELLQSGTFDGTYTTYNAYGEIFYIFSRSKLDSLMIMKIEAGHGLQ